jgi:putative transposase
LALIRWLVDERPTYEYRRITRLVNRRQKVEGKPDINAERVLRLMQAKRHRNRPALECSLVLRSLRACLRNGEIVRVLFAIDPAIGISLPGLRPRGSPAIWCAT